MYYSAAFSREYYDVDACQKSYKQVLFLVKIYIVYITITSDKKKCKVYTIHINCFELTTLIKL